MLEAKESGEDAAQVVELDQTRQGRLSRMDAMQQQAMSLAAGKRRELELRKVTQALSRIAEGSYGYCVECEAPIPLRRLQVDLTAQLCVPCAEGRE
ncbi:MAG: TraR/DksA family transcriptional regulator [Gammaproteobacteria bacterium]